MTIRAVAVLLVSVAVSLALPAGAQTSHFEDEIDVSLATVVVRVVDTWGAPILDLKPEDFRVRAGRSEIPVIALDWIGGEAPPAPAAPVPVEPGKEEVAPVPERGRLVVFFVQADLNPTRISGQLRLRPHT